MELKKDNSDIYFIFRCAACQYTEKKNLNYFLENILADILDLDSERLLNYYKKRNLKFYHSNGVRALQFRKNLQTVEAGSIICFMDKVHIIRGFPKIRRTLLLKNSLKKHFTDKVAVEEKMNGYNVRIVSLDGKIVAFTRGGFICPFTTKKATEIMNLDDFFQDHPDKVICGEMVGTANPYVSHYYPEIGNLGFRIFDIREKITNKPLSIQEKRELLKGYGLTPVKLWGIYELDDAPRRILKLVKKLGQQNREGVVIKDPLMEITPLKYTSSQAHTDELEYAFSYAFDLAQAFFFSRVIREGFQAYEMQDSEEELRERAKRIGEAILYPLLETIQEVAAQESAREDLKIEVETRAEAEEFVRHLRDLGVTATVVDFHDGIALIRRIHNSTTDKINHYLQGGLY